MRKRDYQIVDKANSKKLADFLCKDGQLLLPLVELITDTEMALDELIDLTGRAAIEAVLTLSAQELAGPSIRASRPARFVGMDAKARPFPCRTASSVSINRGYVARELAPTRSRRSRPTKPSWRTRSWALVSWRSS